MIDFKSLLPFVLLGTVAFGQNHFELKDASNNYDVKINVQNCDKEECRGKATVDFFEKGTSKKFQTITSDDLNFYLNDAQQPTANIVQLYDEQSPLIFVDFNFDGTEDVAIRNGNNSGYGGPSYEVYVYNSTKKQFVISTELTALASENLGMFQTDSERKRLITFSKSGCCWHLTTEYSVIPNRGLVKVYESEEDATNGERVKVTTKEFRDDKWMKNIKTYPIDEYYKQ